MDMEREIADLRKRLLTSNKNLIECLDEKIKLLDKLTELGSIIRTQYGAIHQMTIDADKGEKAIAEVEILRTVLEQERKDKVELRQYYENIIRSRDGLPIIAYTNDD